MEKLVAKFAGRLSPRDALEFEQACERARAEAEWDRLFNVMVRLGFTKAERIEMETYLMKGNWQ